MNTKKHLLLGAFLVAASVMSGCASVPMASDEKDAAAKTFRVQPGKSNIYVYRNESFGGVIPMTVSLDGKLAGQTGAQTYFMWELEPAPHDVKSTAENTVSLKLNTEAGKAYYIWQEVKMGFWMARSLLQQVDEQTGRKEVAECKRVQSNF